MGGPRAVSSSGHASGRRVRRLSVESVVRMCVSVGGGKVRWCAVASWAEAAGEVSLLDALKLSDGAEEGALVKLARPFVCQSVRPLVALDADVGRDPLDVHLSVYESAVVEFAYCVHERAVGFGFVVFGDGDGGVCAVCE